MRLKLKSAPLLTLLALPTLLTGCSKDQTNNPLAPNSLGVEASSTRAAEPNGANGRGRGYSRVMFVHASPDAPAVDIFVGKRPAARALAFPNNTRYRSVRAGSREVRVNIAGKKTKVIGATVPFERRAAYSVFAVNTVAGAKIEPLLLTDDLSRPAAGMAHVRFVHLSPNAPPVDVAVAGGDPVFGNKAFKEYTPFTPLRAGTYDLEVRLAGKGDVVLPLPGIKFEAGKIYTVFAKGLVRGTGRMALGAQIIVNSGAREDWRSGGDDKYDGDDDDDRDGR